MVERDLTGLGRAKDKPSEGPEVLVVDDEVAFCDVVTRFLTKRGFRCGQAYDVPSAMNFLREHPGVVLVITDLSMPGEGGLELLAGIRAEYGRNLEFVVVTGDGGEAERARSSELGVREFFRKPVDLKKLGAVVADLRDTHHYN